MYTLFLQTAAAGTEARAENPEVVTWKNGALNMWLNYVEFFNWVLQQSLVIPLYLII